MALKKVEGVDSVRVSLNEGSAHIWFEPDNRVTIYQIHQVIQENGFTPKATWARIKGKRIQWKQKTAFQVDEANNIYIIIPHPEAKREWEEFRDLTTGSEIIAEGIIRETERQKETPVEMQLVKIER